MPDVDPAAARQFALEVVRRLHAAGHQALWAGGCVRDQLMGNPPKDYDVATDARPERVREIFGRRRTLEVGAAFGVVAVLGPRGAGQIDVATFRHDAAYSDGRHPDAVTFADAQQDALRRDFTINGLFYDPLADRVIDYVGGEDDLRAGVIRAIGNPEERLAEDKLRMLRAVRFAARFRFVVEPATLGAIRHHARELAVVSAERIAAEMRQILVHPSRADGIKLLATSGLLDVVLPEATAVLLENAFAPPGDGEPAPSGPCSPPAAHAAGWPAPRFSPAGQATLAILAALVEPTFAMALAALVRELKVIYPRERLVESLFHRWKLATEEAAGVNKFLAEETLIRTARQQPWRRLQRVLAAPRAEELVAYARAVARVLDGSLADVDFCHQKLAQPRSVLDPPPLLTGDDLKRLGLPPGPRYREILESVRDAQLEGRVASRDEALGLVQSLVSPS